MLASICPSLIPKQAIARVLFQARKLILMHWKAADPPTLKEWINQMGIPCFWKGISSNTGDAKQIQQTMGPLAGYPRAFPSRLGYG